MEGSLATPKRRSRAWKTFYEHPRILVVTVDIFVRYIRINLHACKFTLIFLHARDMMLAT